MLGPAGNHERNLGKKAHRWRSVLNEATKRHGVSDFHYIEERNGGLYMVGSRVSLDSVVTRFREGASPERTVQSFPTLKLWQIYGAIAYYLENEEEIKEYIAEGERELERSIPPLNQQAPELFSRLEAARRQMAPKRT